MPQVATPASPPMTAPVSMLLSVASATRAPAAAPAWTAAVSKPTWHTGDVSLNVAPLNAAPAGRERLELAIAYLDLGDVETARDLLHEVIEGGDAVARDEAAQLLRELG